MIWTVFLILFFIWCFRCWYEKARIPHKFPPGPYGLPVLGYFPILTRGFFEAIQDLHKRFGGIYSVNLGPNKRVVVIGDYEILKDVFKHDELTYRPPSGASGNFRHGEEGKGDSRGLIFSVGTEWQEQRRFSLKSLKDLGFGKSSMETLIHLEVNALNDALSKDVEKPIDLKNRFNISVINALWTLISGRRYELDHPDLLDIVVKIDRLTNSSQSSISSLFPWLAKVAPGLTGFSKTTKIIMDVIGFVQKTITDHVKDFEVSDAPKDFIESYLNKVSSSPKESSFYDVRGHHNLESSILDLLLAGTETTSTALTWAILFLIRYPDIQNKLQKELDTVIGRSELPTLANRTNLPYTEAFIHELLRYTCIAPLGLPHMAGGDVETSDGKFKLPKGTVIFPNLYYVVNDPLVFENPRLFNPDRFIDGNGNFVRSDRMIVFGVGKRDCLGKTLANTQLYLFLTGLLQRYQFTSVEKRLEDIDISPIIGFTTVAPHFKLIVTER